MAVSGSSGRGSSKFIASDLPRSFLHRPFKRFNQCKPLVKMASSSASTTSLPALTTIFTPPNYCTSTVSSYNSGDPTTFHELAWTKNYPQCYPSLAAAGLTFSPGVCPQGYVSIAQSLRTIDSTNVETQMECCPRYETHHEEMTSTDD